MSTDNYQEQIDLLKARLDAFNKYQTIPLPVDLAWQARGFLKESFFVAGTGTVAANGTYEQTIPGSTKTSLALATLISGGGVAAEMIPALGTNNFGNSTTQFDITNPAGTTFRYTYDGNGTDPHISATSIPVGTRILVFIGGNPLNSNASSRPFFTVTGSGSNYFEVDNPVGVAQNNITIGVGGSITGGASQSYAIFVEGTSGDTFSFVVFLFDSLFTTI